MDPPTGEPVLSGIARPLGDPVEPGRHHDVIGGDLQSSLRRGQPFVAGWDDLLGLLAEHRLDREDVGVLAVVVRQFLPRDVSGVLLREVESGQVGELFHRVQVEAVVVTVPGVAYPVRFLDDRELETGLTQSAGHREPGRAGTDDQSRGLHRQVR